MQATREKRRIGPAVWTLVVLVIGLAVGVVLAVLRAGRYPPRPPDMELVELIDVVLSAIGVVLLVALLYVYAKTYSETKARFALGLIVVLTALLFQAALSSPLLFRAFGHGLGGLGPFVLGADAFKTAAFTAFLYLSLQ